MLGFSVREGQVHSLTEPGVCLWPQPEGGARTLGPQGLALGLSLLTDSPNVLQMKIKNSIL